MTTSTAALKEIIDEAFNRRSQITPQTVDARVKHAVSQAICGLDAGTFRVAEKHNGVWIVNEWLKKAVLLSFRVEDNSLMPAGYTNFYDKVASKFQDFDADEFRLSGIRIVPPAAVRRGSYVAPDVVVMPSYVNIGAYVDSGTMIDTWVTVGSCAQIGKNVHLSGGVGIGGVLEPLQATYYY